MSTNAATVERKPKWHPIPPPPPSPKILNLPRRNRHRKQHKKPTKKPYCSSHVSLLDLHQKNYYSETGKGKLERLFGQEREFSRSGCSNSVPIIVLNSSAASSSLSGGRRDRVVEEEEEEEEDEEEKEEVGGERMSGEFMEEKWKFQAEILRAECNFLRMEREVALKKLERNRAQMERTLRSAVQTLISGKKKIFEGKNVNAVLEEEIEELAEKLEELQKSSGLEDLEVRNCNNFDKQACLLQRRLEKIGGLSDNKYVEELQELAEPSLSISNEVGNGSCVLDSRSNKSIDESVSHEDAKCTGRCKAVVRRIVEQVRAETEQWSQMQGMLLQVRKEMEELQNSRKFWEDQALNSDREVQCLQSSVQEWKEKALRLETKAKATETELADLKVVLEKLKTAQAIEQCRVVINDHITPLASISEQLRKENHARGHILKKNHLNVHKACREENAREMLIAKQNGEIMASNESLPLPLGKQLEKEKRMLRRLKEKCRTTTDGRRKLHTYNSGLATLKRSPFDDIGNLSEL
ncbi:myosin-9 [Coffea eugenioides]|uniref:myosin-9 n=1 Tax=Coffea eugenioides TaxID=49369 RepID=UPI000F610A33|nr:myosin-9 [Coffea eugenioides]